MQTQELTGGISLDPLAMTVAMAVTFAILSMCNEGTQRNMHRSIGLSVPSLDGLGRRQIGQPLARPPNEPAYETPPAESENLALRQLRLNRPQARTRWPLLT